jgi:K+ transporter
MADEEKQKAPLFDLGTGIKFGQRLFMFSCLAVLGIASLVLYACGLISEAAYIVTISTAGTVGTGGVVMRGVQAAAREKAHATVEIGEGKDAIGFRMEDDG